MPRSVPAITDALITKVRQRIANNQPVRRTLPNGGRIHIDRQLPFLVVYRPPLGRTDAGTAQFAKGEASYLVAPTGKKHQRRTATLVEAVAAELADLFGAFLVVEVWSGPDEAPSPTGEISRPGFRVVVPRRDADTASVAKLVDSLDRISAQHRNSEVALVPGGRLSPPGLARLSPSFGTTSSPIRMVGIEVRPIHRNPETGEIYPAVMRSLQRQISRAIQQSAYEFAVQQTTHRPRHYQALGRRAFVKAVTDVDRQLAGVASAFDLLLMVSPVNTDRAYRSFIRHKATGSPTFRYRPVNVDPVRLKRALYRIPIERVEDPTLAAIFYEKQRELSLKLDLLSDRGTERFVHTGVALYGAIDTAMVNEAASLLARLPTSGRNGTRSTIDARAFAARAAREIERYAAVYPAMGAHVEVRDDISSLMVSSGSLLVGSGLRIPVRRAEALIQHEVGTHVVTYWNGAAQRLGLLATGLAGHDELQEGLAVLAEYLVAGLTPSRLRTIAGRVLAASSVLDGADFTETFRLLTDSHDFSRKAAFQIAMRVHRGGGLVKDAVYLRGLHRVVAYLAEGGRLDTLLVGKISVSHVAVIEELQRRGVLVPPPLRPAYLDDPDTHYRLEQLRDLVDLSSLAE